MSIRLELGQEATSNGTAHDHGNRSVLPARPSQSATHGSFWSKEAPKRLRKGGLSPEDAWKVYWAKRKRPKSIARLWAGKITPLAWAWDADAASPECRKLVELASVLSEGGAAKIAKPKSRAALNDALAEWLSDARRRQVDADFALGCLAAAHLLNELGGLVEADRGWAVLDFLCTAAAEARDWSSDVHAPVDAVIAQQLLACELPLTLSYFFPEMGPTPAFARSGRQRLREGLAALIAAKGIVRGRQLDAYHALAACWTRCHAMGNAAKQGAWNGAAKQKYAQLVRQMIRWCDATGRLLLSAPAARALSPDLRQALLRQGAGKPESAAARALLANHASRKSGAPHSGKRLSPSAHSEQAGLAIMRAGWSPIAAAVAVNYDSLDMKIEAAANGRTLFQGSWSVESIADGKLLRPAGRWEAACWFSDADIDYLELALDLEDGAKLQRQILLARRDEFLLVVDHLQNPAAAALELTSLLPASPALQFRGEDETRDAVLSEGKPVTRLLPLGLPEWRIDPRGGELTFSAEGVRISQRATSRAMACPLFIDLNARRSRKPCTWRQLTVAESLQIVPADVAIAYRIQCGKDQWVYYRAQSESANRTFLGQNTSHECVVARFLASSGEIKELIEIEA
jgi:hypothetical protein